MKFRHLDIKKDSVYLLFFSYFIPSFFAMMALGTYSVFDGIFVGQKLGDKALAAVGVAWAIFPAMAAFHLLFGVGSASIASYFLGKNKPRRARMVFNSVFFFALFSSAILGLLAYFFSAPIARLLGASAETEELVISFMNIFFLGLPVIIIHPLLDIFAINDKKQVLAMVSMLVVAALNIILNYIFLFVLEIGIMGSSLATILAHFVGLAILLPHFLFKKGNIYFERLFNFRVLLASAKNGIPQSSAELSVAVMISLFNHRLFSLGGDYFVSIYAIIMYSGIMLFHAMLSIAQGIQPISSYNYGANLMDRVRKIYVFGLLFALLAGIIMYTLSVVFDEQLVGLFLRGEHKANLLEDATSSIHLHFLQYLTLGACMVSSVFFQTLQKPLNSFIITIGYSLVFVVIYLYVLSYFYGVNGVWLTWPLSCASGLVVALIISYYEYKKGVLKPIKERV